MTAEFEFKNSNYQSQLWWSNCKPALGRLRQEDGKLEASLEYIARCCLKKQQNKNQQNNKNLHYQTTK
jgi:hypothetical protein